MVIVPEEAEVVKRIYREYLHGYSVSYIAKGLTRDKIPTPSKKQLFFYALMILFDKSVYKLYYIRVRKVRK